MTKPDDPNRVLIFDTTLRDGEQSPGISLNTQEKLEIAQQLARLGVDVIEAGFPITSPGDFEAVQAIARSVDGPIVAGLARTHVADIDAAWNAVRDAAGAGGARIHTFISTSDIHIQHQLQTTREDVKGQARAAVAHAKQYVDDVEFSPMDATRADIEYTAEVCQIAIEEGATTINIPDTVGYTMPHEFTAYLERLYAFVPDLSGVVAVGALPRRPGPGGGELVRRTACGGAAGRVRDQRDRRASGQRLAGGAGDAAPHAPGRRRFVHGGVTREIARTSRLVSRLTGYPVQPNKAIIGRNAFAHESGIHQDGVLKERTTYEIMDATTVGLETNSIVLGKHSGRHALQQAFAELGFDVKGQTLNTAFKRFKEIADKKKQVTALDLEALLTDELRGETAGYSLEWFEVEASSRRPPHAKVGIRGPEGEDITGSFTGDGPIDAIFHAINAATSVDARLREFRIDAVTGGQDALGETSVVLEVGGVTGAGQGVSTDILEAAGRAYVRALSNALRRRTIAEEAEAATSEAASSGAPVRAP